MKYCFTLFCLQVVLNYQRQSTVGWNIWNVLLDFEGGLLSLVQLLLDASVCRVSLSSLSKKFVPHIANLMISSLNNPSIDVDLSICRIGVQSQATPSNLL